MIPTVVLLTAAAMLVTTVAPLLLVAFVKHRRRQQQRQVDIRRALHLALKSTHSLECPAMHITGEQFVKLGKLRPHEELRDEGLIVYKDRLEQLGSGEFVVFLSHQWTADGAPDPGCVQYPVMAAAVRKLAQSLVDGEYEARFLNHSNSGGDDVPEERVNSVLKRMLVWVDYISIPQTPCEMQQVAIRTLAAYCTTATAFIVIAPIAKHQQTGSVCNFTTYQSRMWTRAEQFCHAAVCGLDSMWIATGEGAIDKMASHKLLSMGDRWLTEVCHIFDGAATDDTDRLALVTPILGLYAEMYACAGDLDDRAAGSFGKDQGFSLRKMLKVIEEDRDAIFPSGMVIQPRHDPQRRRSDALLDVLGQPRPRNSGQHGNQPLASADRGSHSTPQRIELFGTLVREMELLLDSDEVLLREMREQGLRRRGLVATAAQEIRRRMTSSAPWTRRRSSRHVGRAGFFSHGQTARSNASSSLAEKSLFSRRTTGAGFSRRATSSASATRTASKPSATMAPAPSPGVPASTTQGKGTTSTGGRGRTKVRLTSQSSVGPPAPIQV